MGWQCHRNRHNEQAGRPATHKKTGQCTVFTATAVYSYLSTLVHVCAWPVNAYHCCSPGNPTQPYIKCQQLQAAP